MTAPKPVSELAGLVYSETPKEDRTDPEARRLPWYSLAGAAGRDLAGHGHRPEHHLPVRGALR